ncbi:MAG: hypothetical protein JW384_03736 [Nitrosomonadaceae bacterium]|nr:hypothetical protein [Nitrosomonadaceae bacterium]
MKIKITDVKSVEINAVFEKINGKAVSHTASHREVFDLAAEMEAKLDALGIPKKDRAGALAFGMSGGSIPSAYKWQRTVNRFKIERKSSEWFLIDASRSDIWGNAAASSLALTAKQRDITLAKFGRQFTVQSVFSERGVNETT